MISPCEHAGYASAGAGLPVRLLSPGASDVSRLEFYSIDASEVPVKAEVNQETTASEIVLKEEAAELNGRLRSQAEEMSAQIELARREAKAEAGREWEQRLEERVAEERARIFNYSEEFGRDRVRYFAAVEGEVVKLALAIAARVLHREAKLDPLLLAGVVRVALGKVAEETVTVLRVPMGDLPMWRDVFAAVPESRLQVAGDEGLTAGECLLDTNVGRVELGVSAQLQEIERGFFDLLQQRPA